MDVLLCLSGSDLSPIKRLHLLLEVYATIFGAPTFLLLKSYVQKEGSSLLHVYYGISRSGFTEDNTHRNCSPTDYTYPANYFIMLRALCFSLFLSYFPYFSFVAELTMKHSHATY